MVCDMASLRGTILTLGESWGCAFMMLMLVDHDLMKLQKNLTLV